MCAGALVLKSGPYAGMMPGQRCRMEIVAREGKGTLAVGETLREYCQARVDATWASMLANKPSPATNATPAFKALVVSTCTSRLESDVDQCLAPVRQIYGSSMADPGPVPFQPNYQRQPQQPIYAPSPGPMPVPATPSGLVPPPAQPQGSVDQPQLNNFQLQLQRDNFPQPIFK